MKYSKLKGHLRIPLFIIAITTACALFIPILTQPAFIPFWNLSKAYNLGTAVSGLTAPIIGMISTIFLYSALLKQTESNKLSRESQQENIIIGLFTQIDTEIANFYYKHKTEAEKSYWEIFRGNEGIHEYTVMNVHRIYQNMPSFGHHAAGKQIYMIVVSFYQLEELIESALIPNEMKILFRKRWVSYYRSYLSTPLQVLNKAWASYPHQIDGYADEIKILQERWDRNSYLFPPENLIK